MISSVTRVLILVDNPLRDLPSSVLLANHLVDRVQVILAPTAQASYEIMKWNPDLVLLNYLRVSNELTVSKLLAGGIPYSVLDTEGGFFMRVPNSDENTYTMTILKNPRLREGVQNFFIWGHELYQTLRSRNIYPEASLKCLGTPRMDFYHPSFRPYFSGLGENNLILVNTSFAGNNPKFSTSEKEKELLISKFGYESSFINKFFSGLDAAMNEYIELVKFLAQKLPHRKILVRPHPFESEAPYLRAFEGFSNVEVNCEGAVGDWIVRSKVLIHYECSTAIEAGFAGVPNLSLEKYRELRPMEHIHRVTEYKQDFSAVLSTIEEIFAGRYAPDREREQALKQIESDIYFKVDGLAYQRIAKTIWESLQFSLKSSRQSRTWKQRVFRIQQLVILSLRSFLKFLVRGYVVPEGKRLDLKTTQDIQRRLERVTHQQCLVEKRMGSSSLFLSKK